MSDIKHEQPRLSRRSFLRTLATSSLAAFIQKPDMAGIGSKLQDKQEETPDYGNYVRLLSLKRLLEIEDAKGNPLGLHLIELNFPGNEVNREYIKLLGMEAYKDENRPLYMVVSNPFGSEKDGEKIIWLIASAMGVFQKGSSPVPNPGLIAISGGDQGSEDIIPESVAVPIEKAERFEILKANPADFEGYLNHLGHLLGVDLRAA